MNIAQRLADIAARLEGSGSLSPRLDAEVIVSHVLGTERHMLVIGQAGEIGDAEEARIEALVSRRARGEPVAYLTGRKEFYAMDFTVSRDVLIPRPETELLVDLAIYYVPRGGSVLDIGTGSGAIALALARNRPDADVTATDISAAALKVARGNAAEMSGGKRIRFLRGDLYNPIGETRYDLIVANPPYIAPGEMPGLQRELSFEPREALVADDDGFQVIARLIEGAPGHLKPGGLLLLEMGALHRERIMHAGAAYGFHVSVMNDYGGLPRVAVCRSSA
jgi:release factor glutamine methyltransferase